MDARGLDITGEQRMTVARRGREFGMELHADEPGMIFQLHDLDQIAVHRGAGNHQPFLFELRAELVVEFVTMAMTLDDGVFAVELTHVRVRREATLLTAETHGAADVAADQT